MHSQLGSDAHHSSIGAWQPHTTKLSSAKLLLLLHSWQAPQLLFHLQSLAQIRQRLCLAFLVRLIHLELSLHCCCCYCL
jgi:hypothetical protein